MISFDEFCDIVRRDMEERYPNAHIELQKQIKNNNLELMGLMIQQPEVNIGPVIYLDGYYKELTSGRLLNNILHEINSVYEKNIKYDDFNIEMVGDYERAKDNIRMRLVNLEKNEEQLKGVPYQQLSDLAITYHLLVTDFIPNEMCTIRINNNIQSMWNISLEELHAQAMLNETKADDYVVVPMSELLGEITDIDVDLPDATMHIVTNNNKTLGAAKILSEAVQDEIAAIYGEKFCVLPSSIHEVLVIPYIDNEMDMMVSESMVQEINETQLLDDEILSDHVYMVDAKTHKMMRLEEHLAMEKVKEQEVSKEKDKIEKQREEIDKEIKPRGPRL